MDCSMPSFPDLHHLPEHAQTHVHWVSDAIQPSHPLLSPSPPTFSLAQHQGLFQWVGSSHQVAKVLQLWPQHQSNEYSGFISFRIDWFDLLAVQGTFKSLLQHCSSKASIPWHSAFFMIQLSHPYIATRKTIAFTIWTCVGKVMFQFFNTLCRFVIAFLPRSKRLLISWMQSPSAVRCNPTDFSLPGSAVHWDSPGKNTGVGCSPVLSSRRSSQPRNQIQVSCIARRFFTVWATREAQVVSTLNSIKLF